MMKERELHELHRRLAFPLGAHESRSSTPRTPLLPVSAAFTVAAPRDTSRLRPKPGQTPGSTPISTASFGFGAPLPSMSPEAAPATSPQIPLPGPAPTGTLPLRSSTI
ncbi:unnamed protein product, partial [Polarella glacialis]